MKSFCLCFFFLVAYPFEMESNAQVQSQKTKENQMSRAADMMGPSTNVMTTALPPGRLINRSTTAPTPGPYYIKCTMEPDTGLLEFTSWAVPDEKSMSEYMSDACFGSTNNAINSLVDLLMKVNTVGSQLSNVWNDQVKTPNLNKLQKDFDKIRKENSEELNKQTSEAIEKLKEGVESIQKLAAGPELFVVNCMWSGIQNWAKETAAGKIFNDLNKIRQTSQNIGKVSTGLKAKWKTITDRIAKGTRLTITDKTLFTDWEDIKKNLELTITSVNLLVAYISDPRKIIPYEDQAEGAASYVEDAINSITGNCEVKTCDENIIDGILAGQEALVAARRYTAQAEKNESKWRQKINDMVKNSSVETRAWEHLSSNDYHLLPIKDQYNSFVNWHNERVHGEKKIEKIKETLTKLGEQCTRLDQIADLVDGRIFDYKNIYYKGAESLANGDFIAAKNAIGRLKVLENSQCGHFFPKQSDQLYSEALEQKYEDAKDVNKTQEEVNWNGTYTDNYSTATISGSTTSFSGTWQYTVGDSKGTGTFSNGKVDGNTVTGTWTVSHEDNTKTGQRKGTFTATLSGDILSGQFLEDTPVWNYKPGYNKENVSSSMKKGAVWPFSWKRK